MQRYAYKVVTENLQSLGLRNNPNILTFDVGIWIPEPRVIVPGKSDHGGIWAARTHGNANHLQKYMLRQHKMPTRIFYAQVGTILYENTYRVKTDRILLLEELVK